MIRDAGFARVTHRAMTRRHRRAPFRLEALSPVIGGRRSSRPRLARVGFVLAREGAFGLVDPGDLPPAGALGAVDRAADRARGAGDGAQRARRGADAAWAVLRQVRPVPGDAARCRRRQGRARSRSAAGPDGAVSARGGGCDGRGGLGTPIDSLFVDFSKPLAAASIAQVHQARVAAARASEVVAVKVLRPGMRAPVPRATSTLWPTRPRTLEKIEPEPRRLRPVEIVETLARSATMEMDLRLEAAALSEMAENTRDDPDFRVPSVDWERTARDVLTIEWIDGIPLNDIAAIEAAGHDRVALGRIVIQSFLRHALRDGFFHADMHPGTCSSTHRAASSPSISASWAGSARRSGGSWPKSCSGSSRATTGGSPRSISRRATCRATIRSRISRRRSGPSASRSMAERADHISMAKLLTLLFEITGLFDMATRTELVMLQKTMVVVEGVAPQSRPAARHVEHVRACRARMDRAESRPHRADRGSRTRRGVVRGPVRRPAQLVGRAERLVESLEVATQRRVSARAGNLTGIGEAEARRARWGNVALWIGAAALVAIAFRMFH